MDGRPHAWLTSERLGLYPAAVLFALVASLVISVLTASGAETVSGRLGGDFPAFFGAGRLVVEGRVAELYDWQAQRDAQADLFPDATDGRFLAFAYPPFVALAYAALVPLGYVGAYVAHTVFMAAAVVAGVLALRPVLPRIARHPLAAVVGTLCVLPLFRAVTGGQNTALTLLLVACCWRLLHDGRPALAGVPLGLLLFKPQLGLPLAGLVLLRTRFAALPALLGIAGLMWLVGAVMGGPGWVGWWWSQIGRFHLLDQAVNAANSVGLLGLLEAWFGPGEPAAFLVAAPLEVALIGALALRWWRAGDLDRDMAAVAPALVLIPPHAMHYDSGLVALSWLALADRRGRAALGTLRLLFLGSLLGEARGWLGWNPMALVAAATLLVSWRPYRAG